MTQSHEFESSADALPIRLDNFEGPLDLLLHLIKKSEVNIHDIPIALITAQYLETIELMHELNLDVAGEYLVMAATLIHIKSRTLLRAPRPRQQPARTSRAIPVMRWSGASWSTRSSGPRPSSCTSGSRFGRRNGIGPMNVWQPLPAKNTSLSSRSTSTAC